MIGKSEPAHFPSAERVMFYEQLKARSLAPLWEVLKGLVTPTPRSPLDATVWHYAQVRPEVMRAGEIISATEAERRVLILENPALPGQSSITQTLYAGLQLLLPGEVAVAHRHTQSALRLVLEGTGAYTAVDGERRTMSRGDFIVTPSWKWHDHGNPGCDPVVWLDGLDIPLVRSLDASFAEHSPVEVQAEARPEGESLLRYGRNLAPVDYYAVPSDPTQLFVYPYTETRIALCGQSSLSLDGHLGHKLRFVNPATGASPIATIGAFAQRIPSGMSTRPYRCSDGTVYVCLEGAGHCTVGSRSFEFGESDVFVVPSWHALELQARNELILFSFSDRPVQQSLGLWREERC